LYHLTADDLLLKCLDPIKLKWLWVKFMRDSTRRSSGSLASTPTSPLANNLFVSADI
jgi:hypothetical protein